MVPIYIYLGNKPFSIIERILQSMNIYKDCNGSVGGPEKKITGIHSEIQ
jgi:hypothetical protein